MYLVDTNVISELSKRHANAAVVNWFSTQRTLALSAITLEELTYGVERIPVEQSARLRQWFYKLLAIPPLVVAVDDRIAQLAGRLRAGRERAGRPVTQADMLIAATALVSGRILVTRNAKDFYDCGVTVLNPFTDP
ncbi:type II toxin-antitoxin system VapC family toxin [bacterium]|nr:type II toxin-antitoxin system VapC family toxin [bacterium]